MMRIVGEYGDYNSGVLYIIFVSIHGNEKAGYHAIKELIEELNENNVPFQGKIVSLVGNISAFELNQRFIHKDLNRQWYSSKISKLGALPFGLLNASEDIEQKQILDNLSRIFHKQNDKKNIVMIDMHTTSAHGPCMSITNTNPKSVDIAKSIPATVIDKMTSKITGTTLEYFDNLGVPGIAFEAGQHDDVLSIKRSKSCLTSIFLNANNIDSKFSHLFEKEIKSLRKYNEGLPFIVEVVHRHIVIEDNDFQMNKGFVNFQKVKKGEFLALNKQGKIFSPQDGRILMPLYQEKGSDGFFIVQ